MTLTFPYQLKIPSQGVLLDMETLEEVSQFVQSEAAFIRELGGLVSAQIVVGNTNHGTTQLSNKAEQAFKAMITAMGKNELGPFENYLTSAQNFRVLVGAGRVGQHVKELLKRGDQGSQQQARWIAYILCSEWTDGEPDKVFAPYRAAFAANPTSSSYGDLISASDALSRSSIAVETSEKAQQQLDIFIKEKTDLFEKLEELYRSKLTLDEPALTWEKIAQRKTTVWSTWLAIFAILVAAPIMLAVMEWSVVSGAVTRLTAGANGSFSIAGLATITVPALFYAWLLKNVSRVFLQNLNLADDAAHRRSLALTYMGLLQDEKHPASDQDRAIILNALFRPIPPQTADEGPPAGVLDLIRNKG